MDEPSNSEIDSVIATLYAAFDNRGPRKPATAELRKVYVAGGGVIRVSASGMDSWTIEEFLLSRDAMLTDGTLVEFHEWETSSTTTVFENIASRQSHYAKAGTLHGAAYTGKGRKFIQLCRADGRWLIASVLWEDALTTQPAAQR